MRSLSFSQKDPKISEISKTLIFPSGKSVRKFWTGTSEIKASPDYDYGKQYFKSIARVSVTSMGSPGGGVLLEIFGGGVPPASPNPDPISDQKMPFPIPVFRPGLKNPYPFSDLTLYVIKHSIYISAERKST